MTLAELCLLRDKLITDKSYSDQEHAYLYGLLQDKIHEMASHIIPK